MNENENAVQTEEIIETEGILPTKEKRKLVQVSQADFIQFLAECKKKKLPQSKMKGEYAQRFGGAEQTAIQKYADLIKQYHEMIEQYKKKEQTEEVKVMLGRLTRRVELIKLPDGREGKTAKEATEEDRLQNLLNLIDLEDEEVGEETDV